MKIPLPLYCLLPLYPFFKICTPPMPFFPCHLQPTLPLFFLSCFFGWIGDLTTLNVLFQVMIIWIYTCQALWRILISALCNKAPSLQRSDIFLLVLWFDITHKKHTQHTQGPVDWHIHVNIYLHHLLRAHSSYLCYIKD